MLKRLLMSGLIASAFTSSQLPANNLKADSVTEALKLIESALKTHKPADTLICFDVDLTLTVTSEVAAQWPSIQAHKQVFRDIFKTLSSLEGNTLLNLSTKTQPPVLIEETSPRIIQELISNGVKVIALTDSMTGQLSNIKSVKEWRVGALENLGINFRPSFPEYESLQFSSLTENTQRHPEFYHGVLLTDSGGHKDVTKGSVLVAFLKAVNYTPKVVVMLDDRVKYLDVIRKSLKSFNPSIQFIGIEYTGGQNFSTGTVSAEEFRGFWENLARRAKEESLKDQPKKTS